MRKFFLLLTILFLWRADTALASDSDSWWVAGGYYVCSTQGNCDAQAIIYDAAGNPVDTQTVPAGESYLVPLDHSAHVALSCGPSNCRIWPAGHVIAPAGECTCDADVIVYDSDEQPVDSFTVYAGGTYTVTAEHTAQECMVCGASPPPPTPTPVPSAPQPCNNIFLEQQLEPGGEAWLDIQPCPTCIEVETVCSNGDGIRLYGNGLFLGECGDALGTFYARGALSSTLTLLNAGDVTATAQITVTCDSSASGQSNPPFPTPTPWLIPTPTAPISGYAGQGSNPAFLALDLGGDPTDPGSPAGQWLGYGQDTVSLINGGNLLYIVGGILTASMVLAWAIDQVKSPRKWG